MPIINKPRAKSRTVTPAVQEQSLLASIAQKRQLAERIEKELAEAAPLISRAAGHLLACEVFDLARKPDAERRNLLALFTLLIRLQQHALAERKVSLLGAFSPAKGANAPAPNRRKGLSPETLRQIEEMANLL